MQLSVMMSDYLGFSEYTHESNESNQRSSRDSIDFIRSRSVFSNLVEPVIQVPKLYCRRGNLNS